ncbi:hypothetical protein D3C75_653660 [compost metagenome]
MRANRETTDTFITPFHQQQAIVFNFQINGHIRLSQFYTRRFNVLIQATADVTFNFNRTKLMLTTTFHSHAEGFAFQLLTIKLQRLFEDIMQIGKWHIFNFKNVVDTRNAGQRFTNGDALIFIFSANFNVVPMANNRQVFIVVL